MQQEQALSVAGADKGMRDEMEKRLSKYLAEKYPESGDLTSYVFVMLDNKKTRAQIVNSLKSFISDPEPFCDWLAQMIQSVLSHQPQQSEPATLTPLQQQITQDLLSPQRQQTQQESSPPAAPMVSPPPRTKQLPMRGRERGGVFGLTAQERQQQRSGVGRGARLMSREPRPPRDTSFQQRDSHKRGYDENNENLAVEIDESELEFTDDPPNRREQRRPTTTTTAPSMAATEAPQQSPTKKRELVKCQFFPNCTNPVCPFFHPTEPCPDFPKCAKGKDCMFIHPAKPCAYGNRCTRPGCNFTHPPQSAGRGAQMPAALGQMMKQVAQINPMMATLMAAALANPKLMNQGPHQQQQQPMLVKSTKPCRYGDKCTNQMCTYSHPSNNSNANGTSNKVCRHGWACPGRSTGACHFKHPAPACKYGPNCTRYPEGTCKFAHGECCQFGEDCCNPECTMVHEQPLEWAVPPPAASTSTTPTSDMMEQQTSPSPATTAMQSSAMSFDAPSFVPASMPPPQQQK